MANTIGGSDEDVVRSPGEVARRALALFSVVGLAVGAPKAEIVEWLQEEDLYDELAPSERRLMEAANPSEQAMIDAGWLSERLIVLCWALGKLDELPEPDEQCDTGELQDILPPFADVEVAEFIEDAALRPDAELVAMADTILNQHWHARDATLKATSPRIPVDIEIVQERHHAINWIIGYYGAAWDEVTTDT